MTLLEIATICFVYAVLVAYGVIVIRFALESTMVIAVMVGNARSSIRKRFRR